MVYAYDDGGGNEMNQAPIKVTVSLSGGAEATTRCGGAGHLRPGQPRLLSGYEPEVVGELLDQRRRSAPRSRGRPRYMWPNSSSETWPNSVAQAISPRTA